MLFNIIGWIGATVYVVAYLLMSMRVISAHSKRFHALNLLGAIGVSIAAIYNNDTPSIVLNVVWGIIALSSIVLTL